MKRPFRFLTLAAMAAAAAVSQPHQAHAQRAEATFVGNVVSLELSKTEIEVGEPIYLKFRVTNVAGPTGQANYGGQLHLSEGNDIEVMVQPPGQLPARYNGAEEPGLYAGVENSVELGSHVDEDFMLMYEPTSPNGLLFREPGTYILTAKAGGSIYRDPKSLLVTLPPTRITVKPAQGANADALKIVADKAVAKALHTAFERDAKVLSKVRELHEKYPTSAWEAQALSVLGNDLLYGAKPDQAAAVKLMADLALRFPNSPRAPASLFNAAAASHRMGLPNAARAYYYLLKDLYPGYNLLRRDNPIAGEYDFVAADLLRNQPWYLFPTPWVVPTGRTAE